MKISVITYFLVLTLVLTSCMNDEKSKWESTPLKTPPTTKTVEMSNSGVNYKNNSGLEVKNNEIFYNGKSRGKIEWKRIFINFEDRTYSFEAYAGIEKLDFNDYGELDIWVVSYDGLRINLPAIFDTIIISYKCDGPLGTWDKYYSCETDGTGKLSQYEFWRYYRSPNPGWGYTALWRKLIIQEFSNKNVIFEITPTHSESIESDPSLWKSLRLYKSLLKYNLIEDFGLNTEIFVNYNESTESSIDFKKAKEKLEPMQTLIRGKIQSKEYLDAIRRDEENKEVEKKWDIFIESFRLEKNK